MGNYNLHEVIAEVIFVIMSIRTEVAQSTGLFVKLLVLLDKRQVALRVLS